MPTEAAVLAGGEATVVTGVAPLQSNPLLPVLNEPLLRWQIRSLARNGIEDVFVAVSPSNADGVRACLEGADGLEARVHTVVDSRPRGPAGALEQIRDRLAGECFVVLEAQAFLGEVELRDLVEAHLARSGKATMGTLLAPPTSGGTQRIVALPDGTVDHVAILHESRNRRRSRRFSGVYVLDRGVLTHVPSEGYFDIKEQLIPWLREQGERVLAEDVRGYCVPIDSYRAYRRVHEELLERGAFDDQEHEEVGEQVWIGRGTEIASTALAVGPVLLGRNCVVEDGARIIGPAVIGHGTVIGAGSLVRSSICWSDVHVSREARLEHSIVGTGCSVGPGRRLSRSVVLVEGRQVVSDAPFEGGGPAPSFQPGLRAEMAGRMRALTKSIVDYVGASVCLVLFAPVMFLCALVIRWDSPGSIFYRQKRCGRYGREFEMLKLRTMVEGADRTRGVLEPKKDVDGPVFKLKDDPRITSVGRFLRRTSLDELPQFLNVLKGEMSLVGPRPLTMQEMRCCPAWRDRRLTMKPGISGIWQVNGRSRASFEDWIRCDLEYVKKQSLWLDTKILFLTVRAVVRGTGAY